MCVVSYSEQIYRLNLKVPHKQPGFNLEYFANNVLKVCKRFCVYNTVAQMWDSAVLLSRGLEDEEDWG